MYEALLNAVIPVCSVIIGMVGQHYLSRSARSEDATRERKLESYSSYVSSVCRCALLKDSSREYIEANIELAAARAKICVYGSDSVMRALAKFEENRILNTQFIHVIEAMRNDGRLSSVSTGELQWVIFGNPERANSP